MNKKVLAVLAVVIGLNVGTMAVGLIYDAVGHQLEVEHSNAYYDCMVETSQHDYKYPNRMTRWCYGDKVDELKKAEHSHIPFAIFGEHPSAAGWLSIGMLGILALVKLDEKPKPKPTKLADMLDDKEQNT